MKDVENVREKIRGRKGGRIGEVVLGKGKRKSRKGSGVEEMGREKKGVQGMEGGGNRRIETGRRIEGREFG